MVYVASCGVSSYAAAEGYYVRHKPDRVALIRTALAVGDDREALRLAASFPHLGPQREAISRGWQAAQRPDFYRELGQDPDAHVAAGVAAVRERYERP